MSQAFVIMQIGNAELERIYDRVIAPALEACGFSPRRVDRHNSGGLLASEIISFLEESEILIADLTNERPNCYLEVGYALGLGKSMNLILTAREDHDPASPRHRAGGPRVHFDLAGYDILYWHAERLAAFRQELEKRIQRRRLLLGRNA
jgi:nucleoside 2-deoxyribosyltransferase